MGGLVDLAAERCGSRIASSGYSRNTIAMSNQMASARPGIHLMMSPPSSQSAIFSSRSRCISKDAPSP